MEPVPAYLIAFFWRIRRHSGEDGYLVTRLEPDDLVAATDQLSMLRELVDLHFIALTDKEEHLVFSPLVIDIGPGARAFRAGTEEKVDMPTTFWTLARGRWCWTELLTRATAWAITASIGAVLGALFTLLIVGHRHPEDAACVAVVP